MITGKLEVMIKINEMPEAKEIANGWKEIKIQCDNKTVTSKLKPKFFKKLEETKNFPLWVATISGKIGEGNNTEFELLEPNIQVFERKPKEVQAPSP